MKDNWEAFRQAVKSGQEGAIRGSFEDLYESVKDEMVRFAGWCARKHNRDRVARYLLDPEEVVEDAFADLYVCRLKINKDAKKWMLGAISKMMKFRASRAWKEANEERSIQYELDAPRGAKRASCSVPRELRIAIHQAVLSLPARMKSVIVELYYRKESVATTAEKLGISENAVVQTRRRALLKLERLSEIRKQS